MPRRVEVQERPLWRAERFRAALLTALGLTPVVGCGGVSSTSPAPPAGPEFPCEDPQPLASDPTGAILTCSDGWSHRTESSTCPSILPRAGVQPPSSNPTNDQCTSDGDCISAAHGYCQGPGGHELAPAANYCYYGCVTDADCGSSALCQCGDPVGTCIQSTCKTDADCGDGFLCASYIDAPGCNFPAFACQSAADECMVNADCTSGTACTVLPPGNGARACVSAGCSIGRPFLVEGELRAAGVVDRSDWWGEGPPAPDMAELSTEVRAELATVWADVGCLEHASIAAFARFVLELLSFGAPAELVTLATTAMADETRHAELSFALASAYADRPLGPGALPVHGAAPASSLAESVRTAFLEGCIGETVAALEAAEAHVAATAPAPASALARIAEDEARHAELAWRYVAWALPRLGASEATSLRQTLESEVSAPDPLPLYERDAAAHGVLGSAQRRAIRRIALSSVIGPCLEALLVGVEPRRSVDDELRPSSGDALA